VWMKKACRKSSTSIAYMLSISARCVSMGSHALLKPCPSSTGALPL
jgi:hypothetical protein